MSELRPTGSIPEVTPASALLPNWGNNRAPSEAIKGMPFNYGEGLLPHVVTFQGIVSSTSRVYRYYDEAMKASMENARFMENDLMLMEPVEQRRRACALLNWHLEVDDESNPTEKRLCEDLTKIIKAIPGFVKFRECLLKAVWAGKSGVQWPYRWKKLHGVTPSNGTGQNMILGDDGTGRAGWRHVHGDKIVFRYDDGTREYSPNQIGIRVGAGYTAGDKGIQGRLNASGRRKVEATDYGLAYFLEPWERDLLAIHKHMVEDGEYEDPQSAGKIHGVGIRSRVYWSWYIKQELVAWLMEYMERCAAGIEIWYYPYGNDEAEKKARKAAEERIGNSRNVILMPRPVGEDGQAYGVEIVQPNMSGADTVERIVSEFIGDQIMRYILGQTMTNKAQSAGLGSDLPQIQLGSYLQIIRYDALGLGETLTTDVVAPLKIRNYPHLSDIPVRFVIDTESEDMENKLSAWKQAYEVGVRTKASDWLRMIGASKPEKDDEVIENPIKKQQDRLYQQWLEQKATAEATGQVPPPAPGMEGGPAQVQGGLGEEPPAGPEGGGPTAAPGNGPEAEGNPFKEKEPEQYAMNAGENPRSDDYGDDKDEMDIEQIVKGTKEEMEHTDDWRVARKIAMDHLHERPDYYDRLEEAMAQPSYSTDEPDRYMRADKGIAEGQHDRNWNVPAIHGSATSRYSMHDHAGGPSGRGQGCSCPEGICACDIITPAWLQETKQQLANLGGDAHGYLGHVAGFSAYKRDFDREKIEHTMDAVEGMNGERYPRFVPEDQIWVDQDLDAHEWPPILLHEAAETTLMRHGWGYEKAHEAANHLEKHYRKQLGEDEPERYAKRKPAADEQTQEVFWQGNDGEITVIEDNRPIRYSRKHGNVSVEIVA